MFKIYPAQLIKMVDHILKKEFDTSILNPNTTIQWTIKRFNKFESSPNWDEFAAEQEAMRRNEGEHKRVKVSEPNAVEEVKERKNMSPADRTTFQLQDYEKNKLENIERPFKLLDEISEEDSLSQSSIESIPIDVDE